MISKMQAILKILYWPSLLIMIPSLLVAFWSNGELKIAGHIIGAVSSSLILYCKTYDWLIVLAFKRKKLDKAFGIHTGWYFIIVTIVSVATFLYSYSSLLFCFDKTEWEIWIFIIALFMIFCYVVNLVDAYKANPNDVLNILKK